MAPSGTARSTPATACVSPKDFARPVASIASGACVVIGLLTSPRALLSGDETQGPPSSDRTASRFPGDQPGRGAQAVGRSCRWTRVISPPAATDERTPALPSAVGDPRAAELLATVVELEMLARFDRGNAEQRAERAVATARELGLTELEQRAQRVRADLLRRRGNVAEAGRVAQDVHRWATDNDSRRTLARSHFVLSAVFQELGDVSLALEHSVRSVDLLDEDADPAMRVDHMTRLGDCLALNGDEAARERYAQVQLVAEELGDVDRRLMVLNNRAYTETLFGDFEAALHYSLQLQEAAAAHGVPLHIGRLDTVARALMGLD